MGNSIFIISRFLGSDDEDENNFGITSRPPPPPTTTNKKHSFGDSDDDKDEETSASSNESDKEPEPPKPKQMTELEKAVLRRRAAMGDPDAPPVDDVDEVPTKKPTKPSTESR